MPALPVDLTPGQVGHVAWHEELHYAHQNQVNIAARGADPTGVADSLSVFNTVASEISSAGGGTIYVPEGTYALSNKLVLPEKVCISGDGMRLSLFKMTAAPTGDVVLDLDRYHTIEDIGIDGTGLSGFRAIRNFHATTSREKWITIRRVRITNFVGGTSRGILLSSANFTRIENCEIIACRRAIVSDFTRGPLWIVDNLIDGGGGVDQIETGIGVTDSSPQDEEVHIEGNTVARVTWDSSGNGSQGWGIKVSNVRGVSVKDNHIYECSDPTETAASGGGILIGEEAHDANVQGNDIKDCVPFGTGIYVEIEIPDRPEHLGQGTGQRRGALIAGNTIRNCQHGIRADNSPGCQIVNNRCSYNYKNGITAETTNCLIQGNVCYDNWASDQTPTSPMRRAGITAQEVGSDLADHVIVGNRCFDNRTTQWAASTAYSLNQIVRPTLANRNGRCYIVTVAGTSGASEPTWPTTTDATVVNGTVTFQENGGFQEYGLSVRQEDSIITNNMLKDCPSGGIYEDASGGGTNIVANNKS